MNTRPVSTQVNLPILAERPTTGSTERSLVHWCAATLGHRSTWNTGTPWTPGYLAIQFSRWPEVCFAVPLYDELSP